MAESKLTFYERHPVMAKTGIALGLVGLLGAGALGQTTQAPKQEKEKAKQEYVFRTEEFKKDLEKLFEKYKPELEQLQQKLQKDFSEMEKKIQESYKGFNKENMPKMREEMQKHEQELRGLGARLREQIRPYERMRMGPGPGGMQRMPNYGRMQELKEKLKPEDFEKLQKEMMQLREKQMKESDALIQKYIK